MNALQEWHSVCNTFGVSWKLSEQDFIVVQGRGILYREDDSDLRVFWSLHSGIIAHWCNKFSVSTKLIVALTSIYAQKRRDYNCFAPHTCIKEPTWISDETSGDRVRYGYTGIRLSDAWSVADVIGKDRKSINSVFLRNPSHNFHAACAYLQSIQQRKALGRLSQDPILNFAVWDVGSLMRGNGIYGLRVKQGSERIDRFVGAWNSFSKILNGDNHDS